ncbi:MAG: FAD-dependent oxidoreductase, partial [Clostridia bacterium]|nr:FAD-dependent oxidoreductase [Clostridia bacterium]
QAMRFGLEFKTEEVSGIDFTGKEKVINTNENNYLGKAVVIATGSRPRFLDVPGEREFHGRGVSYCATCDGAFFKEKKVVVVGGGDAAVEEALFLTRYANEVVLVHRRDQLRATKVLQDRAKANSKIHFILDTVVEKIDGKNFVDKVQLKNVKSGETRQESTNGVFVFVGTLPNTGFLQGAVEMNNQGYILTHDFLSTSVSGVFAAGDVREKFLRQVSTAVGDGAEAAMAAERYIAGLD